MDSDSVFTENFFSYFNNTLHRYFLKQKDNDEIDLLIKKLYSNEEPLYYLGPPNDLKALKDNADFLILQGQLNLLMEKIEGSEIIQNTSNLYRIRKFLNKLLLLENNQLMDFYGN